MHDVVALEELVIDFSLGGVSAGNHTPYGRQPDDMPSSILATIAGLGGRVAIMGVVGDDSFGYYLKDMARSCDIDCMGLCFTGDAYTTPASVYLDSGRGWSFTVMRKLGVDTQLRKEQVHTDVVKQTGIFHVSAATLTDEPCWGAAFYATRYAGQEKEPVSFDANYRDALWDREKTIHIMETFLPLADILKVSEKEIAMLTGTTDIPQGAKQLYGGGISLVTVTCGKKGSYRCCQGGRGFMLAYQVQAVDTNGAGDVFLGTSLCGPCQTDSRLGATPLQQMRHMIKAASAVGAPCAVRLDALVGSPVWEKVRELMGKSGQ